MKQPTIGLFVRCKRCGAPSIIPRKAPEAEGYQNCDKCQAIIDGRN